jgi:RNA polymerase sigma-70 factor (ECF subfamily)
MTPDDFVQQTFLKLWERRNKLKEEVLLDKQLYTICKSLILNTLKRDFKATSLTVEKFIPEENTVEDLDAKNKKLEWLYATIQKLLPKRKKIFLLHEIATALEISKKTIANHLYLANNFLKEESRRE